MFHGHYPERKKLSLPSTSSVDKFVEIALAWCPNFLSLQHFQQIALASGVR